MTETAADWWHVRRVTSVNSGHVCAVRVPSPPAVITACGCARVSACACVAFFMIALRNISPSSRGRGGSLLKGAFKCRYIRGREWVYVVGILVCLFVLIVGAVGSNFNYISRFWVIHK